MGQETSYSIYCEVQNYNQAFTCVREEPEALKLFLKIFHGLCGQENAGLGHTYYGIM